PPVDAVLLLYAADAAELEAARHQQSARLGTAGLRQLAAPPTRGLDAYEHFGFHDGISQPIVEGLARKGPWAATGRAGEVVLGYPNEYGLYTEGPGVDSAADPAGVLPKARATGGGAGRDLGRNGTYRVLRQLAQHVHRFWQFADREAKNQNESHFDSSSGPNGPAAR